METEVTTGTTEFGKLFAALAKAQAKIEGASKDKRNPAYNSKYADLASIWDACRGPLGENELCVVQQPLSDGARVGLRTTIGHSSGQWMASVVWTTPKDQGPQALGSCLTYLRRYSLAAAVGVTPDDDDGNAAEGRGADPKAGKATPAPRANTVKSDGTKASADQVTLLQVLRRKAGVGDCDGKCAKAVKEWSKKANGLVDKTVRCVYHTQLAAFKTADGLPVLSSKDLAPDQISNLIDRYQAKVSGQERRASEPPDIGAIAPAKRAPNGMTSATMAITGALKTRDMDAAELCAIFNVDDVTEIANEDADKALALVFAWGSPKYAQVLAEVGNVPQ